jgi:thioredoxin-like negative regulator of GroEL
MRRMFAGFRAGLALWVAAHHGPLQAVEPNRYVVAAPGDWVISAPADTQPAAVDPGGSAGGSEDLLIDRQVRVDADSWSEYAHFVSRATNASGVDDNSTVDIDFDPELERLILHAVTVRRGNESIDELQHGRIEILQRESQLDSGILDGSNTLHLVMSDVRVGDTVDYSFTIEHREPIWGNRYFRHFTTQWSTPVRHLRIRTLLRSHAPLFVHSPPKLEPITADDGTWRSFEWNSENVPAVAREQGAPSWYPQYPEIQVSQFANWKELVDTVLPAYTPATSRDPGILALEKKLAGPTHSEEERALAVIRFVQEEIRYTGLELGSGAYRPAAPAEVLKRRYGDCKDKTLLAVSLLRDLGIDAAPAMVSTRWGNHVDENLASPDDFNHVILKMRLKSKAYWLDMTDTAQGGTLQNAVQTNFGAALVIAPGVNTIEHMPGQQLDGPLVTSRAEFDLRAGVEKEASVEVRTIYRGSEADGLRRRLRRQSAAEIGADYLDYYKGRYPTIHAQNAPKVTDDLRANQIEVTESYRLERAFEVLDSGKRQFSVEAELINAHLHKLSLASRATPFELEYPVDETQSIRIRLPSAFPVKDEKFEIDCPQFHYDSQVSHDANDVLLQYRYRSLTDTIPAEALEEFAKHRAAARADTYYRFTKGSDEQPSQAKSSEALKQLERAGRLAQSGQLDKTDEAVKELLASEGFKTLTAAQQHVALYLGGAIAVQKSDFGRASDLLRRATVMDDAGSGDWNLRLLVAQMLNDKADATLSLTTLAERWPQNLEELDYRVVTRTVHETRNQGVGRYQLLSALFNAGYEVEQFDNTSWWRDLALLQLRNGDQGAAAKTLAKVSETSALISVRADNRFAPIRAAVPLDISAALERQTQAARAAVKANPRKIAPVLRLIQMLRQSQRLEEALQLADDAISAASGPKGSEAYDDYHTTYVWLLDARSHALFNLGRWDEATTQMESARQLTESGNRNVSQTINLANEFDDLGKPEAARALLASLPPDKASPYGLMQAAIERVASADQLGDATEVQKQLGYLSQHRDDSLATYQRALVAANRLDEAAKLLVSRLQDPDERIDALLEVQEYKRPPQGPGAAEWSRRWDAVKHRPDVRVAIGKVGNVAQYPILEDLN